MINTNHKFIETNTSKLKYTASPIVQTSKETAILLSLFEYQIEQKTVATIQDAGNA